jgi:predicted transcriptional regulator
MKLTALDTRVLKVLLTGAEITQESIASKVGSPVEAVYQSVQRLKTVGHVELIKDGNDARRKTPRLCVLAALDRLEASVRSLFEATL